MSLADTAVLWTRRHGVLQAVEVRDLPDHELTAFEWCATPLEQRIHPDSCGRPGTGRKAHRRHGTPLCEDCRRAENQYNAARRQRREALR